MIQAGVKGQIRWVESLLGTSLFQINNFLIKGVKALAFQSSRRNLRVIVGLRYFAALNKLTQPTLCCPSLN